MYLVGKLQMGSQDVVFLPYQATFTPHFLKLWQNRHMSQNCSWHNRRHHAPCKIFSPQQIMCHLNFMKIIIVTTMGEMEATSVRGDITTPETMVSVYTVNDCDTKNIHSQNCHCDSTLTRKTRKRHKVSD